MSRGGNEDYIIIDHTNSASSQLQRTPVHRNLLDIFFTKLTYQVPFFHLWLHWPVPIFSRCCPCREILAKLIFIYQYMHHVGELFKGFLKMAQCMALCLVSRGTYHPKNVGVMWPHIQPAGAPGASSIDQEIPCHVAHHQTNPPPVGVGDEAFWGKKPNISNLRVFGSRCYVHNDSPDRRKFDAHAFPAIFIGYPPETKACKYYIPMSRKAGVSRNVVFDERTRSATQHLKIEDG